MEDRNSWAEEDTACLFEALYAECKQPIRRIAWDILRDEMMADDVIQETMMRVMKKYKLVCLMPREKRAAYVLKIAENCALDMYRKRKRETDAYPFLPRQRPVKDADMEQVEQLEQLCRDMPRLAGIPLPYRVILCMKYYQNKTVKQISAELGMTEDMVAYRLKRARQLVREDSKK